MEKFLCNLECTAGVFIYRWQIPTAVSVVSLEQKHSQRMPILEATHHQECIKTALYVPEQLKGCPSSAGTLCVATCFFFFLFLSILCLKLKYGTEQYSLFHACDLYFTHEQSPICTLNCGGMLMFPICDQEKVIALRHNYRSETKNQARTLAYAEYKTGKQREKLISQYCIGLSRDSLMRTMRI